MIDLCPAVPKPPLAEPAPSADPMADNPGNDDLQRGCVAVTIQVLGFLQHAGN